MDVFKTDARHIFALFLWVSLLHCSHYLQPYSLVVGEEEQSYYSTPMTLHPPPCSWFRLHSPALKCMERIAGSQLSHPNTDSEHGRQAWFTSSPSQNKTAGSLMKGHHPQPRFP